MRIVNDNLWFCDDCTIAECNGDYSGMDERRAKQVQKAFVALRLHGGALAPAFNSETGDGVREFDSTPCDCCKSSLWGARHRFCIIR